MKKILPVILLLVLCYTEAQTQIWLEKEKLISPERGVRRYFGWGTATYGNQVLVGELRNETDATGNNIEARAGAIFVYEKDSIGNINLIQKIVASDRSKHDQFGGNISIYKNNLLVGVHLHDEDTTGGNWAQNSGAAYFFTKESNGIWREVKKVIPPQNKIWSLFGQSISIDENYAIVGSGGDPFDVTGSDSIAEAGAAYIYKKDALGNWNEEQKIVSPTRRIGSRFGYTVSIKGDYAMISEMDSTKTSRSVYVFERNANGIWGFVQILKGSNHELGDDFGKSISMSGNTALISTRTESEVISPGDTIFDRGAVYFFEKNTAGIWNLKQRMTPKNRNLGNAFLHAAAMHGDQAIVGGYEDFMAGKGACFIFRKNANNNWVEEEIIVGSQWEAGDCFGSSPSIGDNFVVVGAKYEGDPGISNAGVAYVYESSSGLAIGKQSTSAVYKASPNPTDGWVYLELGETFHQVTLKVRNVTGQEIFTQNYPSASTIHFEFDGPSGIYFIEVHSKAKNPITLKVSKK